MELGEKVEDGDEVVGMRYEKKYMGKYLMVEGEVRVVTGILYHNGRWVASTSDAEQDPVDDRKYRVAAEGNVSIVNIGRRHKDLGKCISTYNNYANLM